MKPKSLIGILLYCLLTIVFSCSDDVKDFVIENKEHTICQDRAISIKFISGNNDYSVSIEDEEIVSVNLTENPTEFDIEYNYEYTKFGYMNIRGRKNGSTTVLIKDNVCGVTHELKINVVDSYLMLQNIEQNGIVRFQNNTDNKRLSEEVKTKMSENSLLSGYHLILVKNENKKLIVQTYDQEKNYKTLYEGTYAFEEDTNSRKWIELSYQTEDKPQIVRYELKDYSLYGEGFPFISWYFGLNWPELRLKSKPLPELRLSPEPTYNISFIEDFTQTYKNSYETLDSAYLTHHFEIYIPTYPYPVR